MLAHEALERIGELFEIEREGKEWSAQARRALREERARPRLDALQVWLKEKLGELLPKSPTAGAIGYMLRRWPVFTRYLDDGRIAIDNNAAERALREIAVGRKNWLFAGSERGGEACAIVTSLIETAKAHGHDPLAYLTDVLERLPTTLNRDVDSLLPMNWKLRDG
ncbi:MAG: IS66 family transposase ISAzs21 [Xanthomonadales bacterium]|nr:IS66 family transposase ISAzs21 [Xanthomonadales bacterium]